MPITDISLRNARARERPYKLADGGGLYLQVTTAGGKHWRLKYRFLGTEKLLSLGAYPIVSLAEARDLRDKAKKLLIGDIDPSEAKKTGKREAKLAAAQTFGIVAREYLEQQKLESRATGTMAKNRWLLEDLASPLSNRPIAQITPPEVLEVLRRVEAKGTHESAQRLRSTMGRVFRFGIATGRATNDPTAALAGALVVHRVQHHPAITDPTAVGQLLRAIDGIDGSRVVRAALQIMALCFPRPGELRHAEWPEIDLDKAIWSVPEHRTKMRRPHSIALAPQAVATFRYLQVISGRGRLVFPGVRSTSRPLSENTLNAALRRLGYGVDEMTSHGFRTIASTLLNESGEWSPDAIERALAHLDTNTVRRAYARGEYWDERVRMAAWWGDYLDRLRLTAPAEKLTPHGL
ncbi:tyrosine-type recombinase/integrase [Phenylobacterium sp.]|uniref:tyrosine-type recombinase/integrase n=1 Tax=Phenylobacterium sp. TaxID=1871053 RepID=UPI003564F442